MTQWRGRRVLVTGGVGFIGSHLAEALVARGAQVRILDNLSTGRLANLSDFMDRVELLEEDVRDLAACRRACQGVEFLFHEAALGSVPRSIADPATTIAVNVCGTANLFSAARDAKVRRVVYASSSSVYGDSEILPRREGEEGAPLSPYAASKVMNEDLADLFARVFGMELVGLRYFNVYGPRQALEGPYAAVIPRFFRAYLAGEAPVIYGDGEQTRDFTFVSDAVAANLLAALAPAKVCGRAYNVGGGRETTIRDLARIIRETLGGEPEPRLEPSRPGDVRHSVADISLGREKLGFQPKVDLSEGIARSQRHFIGRVGVSSATGEAAAGGR